MVRNCMLVGLCLEISALSADVEAAEFSWEYIGLVNGTFSASEMRSYEFYGGIYQGGQYVANTEGPWLGYEGETGFMLKQESHATTPMPIQDNLWMLAYYGDVIGQDTIEEAVRVPLTDWGDSKMEGGVLIDNPSDFYLAFKVDESDLENGRNWYGWVHLSIGPDSRMSLLDTGINLDGGPVVVGVVTPEPSAALLVVLGLGLLGLRRRGRQAYDNV